MKDIDAKHTPPPWIMTPVRWHGYKIVTGNGATVASVRQTHGATGWPADANARLIAAAPELFEALTGLVRDVQDYEAWQRPCLALDRARAALSALGIEQEDNG